MSHHIIGHLGLAAAYTDKPKRGIHARACNLANGDLYTYPTASASVDASQPLTVKWATDCSMSSLVDIYLYSPANSGAVQGWKQATYSAGELSVNLKPQGWNYTETANLYFQIVNKDEVPWLAGPVGPQFTVKYDASVTTTVGGKATTSAKGPTVTNGGNAIMETVASTKDHGISKGAIAAAVVVPILVIALLTGVAIRFWRAREAEKRRRWSAAVSTHSGLEWEKGARPGEKPASILGRPSTHYSFRPGSMATSSVYAVENNMAGAGAGQNYPRPSPQLRSQSAENVIPNVRQSRISFAETTRPDRSSRFSLGDNLRPAIGRLPGGSKSATELVTPNTRSIYAHGSAIADDDEESIHVSPSQIQSPNAFTEANVQRAGQGQRTGRRSFMSLGGGDKRRMSTVSAVSADDFKSAASARGSVDELRDMEAVVMMRRSMMSARGSPVVDSQEQVEALELADPLPAHPAPAVVAGSSTVAYGPDQMLAVYAARGKVSAPSTPAPNEMRSFVHLNTGTVSSAAIEALPHPGPNGSLAVPASGRADARLSGSSETSMYSDDAEVGEAK